MSRFLSSISAPSSLETRLTPTCVSPTTPSFSTRSGCLTLAPSFFHFLLVLRLFHLPSLSTSSLSPNVSSTLQASCSVRDPSRVILNDGSCWTIIGVEMVEFTFNQGVACIQTPVTPFPVITGLEVSWITHLDTLWNERNMSYSGFENFWLCFFVVFVVLFKS